ncbi:MAG: hypothetical protein Q4D62_15110 [Planctomycetia bacterium]|nr:hypothetical protein [Planctomycetia bacterium]
MRLFLGIVFSFLIPGLLQAQEEIQTLWLAYSQSNGSEVTVCWKSAQAGDSTVFYGNTEECVEKRYLSESVTLHQVAIPAPVEGSRCFYRVETQTSQGICRSPTYSFQTASEKELRVAVVGNLFGGTVPETLIQKNVHLFMTAGDNVPCLHEKGLTKEEARENLMPFYRLVEKNQPFFATTVFMPVLGNHDREIAPRGKRVPGPSQFYDVDATAYCRFFPLPGKRWTWNLDIPAFSVRFVALDLNHINDMGTSLQTCHAWDRESEAIQDYRKWLDDENRFLITVQNEKNDHIRSCEKGAWGELFPKGTLSISGFGYFAERSEVDGFSYYNTSLRGRGDRYPDPKKVFFASEDTFLLLTFTTGEPLVVEIVRVSDGNVLDRKTFPGRKK